jgi:hypothetical protein
LEFTGEDDSCATLSWLDWLPELESESESESESVVSDSFDESCELRGDDVDCREFSVALAAFGWSTSSLLELAITSELLFRVEAEAADVALGFLEDFESIAFRATSLSLLEDADGEGFLSV